MRFLPHMFLAVAIGFFAFTVFAIFDFGVIAAFAKVGESVVTLQMTGDIVLGLGAACILMTLDGRQAGIKVGPYIAATCCLGAPGPLLYLAHRFWVINKV